MPRTREQFDLIRSERMNIILTSAMFLFSTKGYDSTTLDEIAKDAGCSHGLLYHYFKDKYTLYDYLINSVAFPMIVKLVKAVKRDQKAKFVLYDSLNAILNALKSDDDQYSWATNLLISIDSSIVEGTKSIRVSKQTNKKVFAWLSSCIERGKIEGDFSNEKNTREVTAAILCFIKGLAYARVRLGNKKFICPSINIIMDMAR